LFLVTTSFSALALENWPTPPRDLGLQCLPKLGIAGCPICRTLAGKRVGGLFAQTSYLEPEPVFERRNQSRSDIADPFGAGKDLHDWPT
jgi:hypothetical protein